jgi:hypothetical protein
LPAAVTPSAITVAGNRVARGCVDAGVIAGGLETAVTVVLTQGESVIEGDYDVLMHVALGDALPSPYDETVDLITALLGNPAGYAVYVVLREVDSSMGTGFVTTGGVVHRFRDLEQNPTSFGTWNLATNALDGMLADQLGQTYVDVTNVGAGVRDVVSDFEVGTRLTLDETDAGRCRAPRATSPARAARSPSMTLSSRPSPPPTAPTSPTRRSPVRASVISSAPIRTASTSATAHSCSPSSSRWCSRACRPAWPATPSATCSPTWSAAPTSVSPFVQALVAGVCEGALNYAAQEIEDQLLDLQIDAVNPELGEEGLSSGGSFVLVDDDQDLTTELVGSYLYAVAWNDPADPAATADIAAPITGDGLRFRTECVDDAACGVGSACVARGSYLKVARVDLGCEKAHGVKLGGESCVGDADCASGLCTPVGAGNALACYEACNANADCAAGMMCGAFGGALDLDDVLAGLGDVEAPGCAAP